MSPDRHRRFAGAGGWLSRKVGKSRGDSLIDVAVASCGCWVWQEEDTCHIRPCGPARCPVQDEVDVFIEQGQGRFVLVTHVKGGR